MSAKFNNTANISTQLCKIVLFYQVKPENMHILGGELIKYMPPQSKNLCF